MANENIDAIFPKLTKQQSVEEVIEGEDPGKGEEVEEYFCMSDTIQEDWDLRHRLVRKKILLKKVSPFFVRVLKKDSPFVRGF